MTLLKQEPICALVEAGENRGVKGPLDLLVELLVQLLLDQLAHGYAGSTIIFGALGV